MEQVRKAILKKPLKIPDSTEMHPELNSRGNICRLCSMEWPKHVSLHLYIYKSKAQLQIYNLKEMEWTFRRGAYKGPTCISIIMQDKGLKPNHP